MQINKIKSDIEYNYFWKNEHEVWFPHSLMGEFGMCPFFQKYLKIYPVLKILYINF